MQKDKEKGQAVEYEHIQGYLLEKAKAYHLDAPALQVVYANLELYEQIRKGDFQWHKRFNNTDKMYELKRHGI